MVSFQVHANRIHLQHISSSLVLHVYNGAKINILVSNKYRCLVQRTVFTQIEEKDAYMKIQIKVSLSGKRTAQMEEGGSIRTCVGPPSPGTEPEIFFGGRNFTKKF